MEKLLILTLKIVQNIARVKLVFYSENSEKYKFSLQPDSENADCVEVYIQVSTVLRLYH